MVCVQCSIVCANRHYISNGVLDDDYGTYSLCCNCRANKFEHPSYITDGTVAMCCCLMLFVIPSSPPTCCCWVGGSSSDRGQGGDRFQTLSVHVPQQANDYSVEEVKEDCELSTADSPDSPAVCESTTSTNQLLQSSGPYCDEYILDWTDVQRINCNIIFLLGGAFALSSAFQESGSAVLSQSTLY